MKAVVKYPGSKWSLAPWIISMFPKHRSYLEPFFGSGAVLFNKPRSGIETVNDLDNNVVNLFECIRENPERLAAMVYMTPYSREVYERAYQETSGDKYEKAFNFFIKLNMGHGFRTNGEKVGWKNDVQGRERAYAAMGWCSLPERIMQTAERLRGVQIENMPAVELIKRFNYENVLIYCDPPYVLETRHGKQYRCEMQDKEHDELLKTLLEHKGAVIISGYDTELYQDMLRGWTRLEHEAQTQTGGKREEVIWLNYEPAGMQMSFGI